MRRNGAAVALSSYLFNLSPWNKGLYDQERSTWHAYQRELDAYTSMSVCSRDPGSWGSGRPVVVQLPCLAWFPGRPSSRSRSRTGSACAVFLCPPVLARRQTKYLVYGLGVPGPPKGKGGDQRGGGSHGSRQRSDQRIAEAMRSDRRAGRTGSDRIARRGRYTKHARSWRERIGSVRADLRFPPCSVRSMQSDRRDPIDAIRSDRPEGSDRIDLRDRIGSKGSERTSVSQVLRKAEMGPWMCAPLPMSLQVQTGDIKRESSDPVWLDVSFHGTCKQV